MVKPEKTVLNEQYLTANEIMEFKAKSKQSKSLELTDEEALDHGSRLIMLFEFMLQEFKPISLSDKDIVADNIKRKENKRK